MTHVLIIEDSYLFGQFVADAAVLAGAGSTEIVETQEAAEAAAQRCMPGMIIADVKLVHGSGVRAVERIAKGRRIPILYVTGYPERCGECPPGSTVIEKPVSHDTLQRSISRLIEDEAAHLAAH
ncbi:response regulator [Sphingomonas sp. 2SG]|jgi:DNA-binding NtrC family response regulator|uniref:response regulator n=1 Tax=Sphingomonas sp. 2SG TaxID=2502201 RepID=UPI0010F865EE|nr:response regulator [Sphingomonas sp. 2SG]